MKKVFAVFIMTFVLLGATAFAQEISIDADAKDFVGEVAVAKGVDKNKIRGVKELDMNALPEKVNLKNIDNNNLALYEIEVENETEPVYVITASSKFFKKTVRAFSNKMLLSFGFNGEILQSSFLKTSTGVVTSGEKGYVMARDGAISALSTNLEIIENTNNSIIEVIIYKNSERVGFRNTFVSGEPGVYSDYDTLSSETVLFEKGDVISIEVIVPENAKVRDVITLLEIET